MYISWIKTLDQPIIPMAGLAVDSVKTGQVEERGHRDDGKDVDVIL